MVSVTTAPDDRWTEVTPAPTRTATQLAGAPSGVPNDPPPKISTVSGATGTAVGQTAVPVPTARSVDSSTANSPHPVVGPGGAGSGGTEAAGPEPPEPEEPGPVVVACGAIIGWAHIAV